MSDKVFYNEIDPFCCDILRARCDDGGLPKGVVDEKDIRLVRPDDLVGFTHCHFFAGIGGIPLGAKWAGWPDDLELWSGGFPCVDISCAGRGDGIGSADAPTARSGLWWEWFRLIEARRPLWLCIENVPALRTRGADDVLTALEGIGYACRATVVGAWAVGAPHKRDRVWIVARYDAGLAGRHLADANSAGIGNADQLRRGERPSGAEAADAGGSGACLADAPRLGRAEQGNVVGGLAADRGEGLADDDGSRKLQPQGSIEEQRRWIGDGGYRWPSRPGEPQHGWEAPRLAYAASARRAGSGEPGASGQVRDEARGPEPERRCGESGGIEGEFEPRLGGEFAWAAEWLDRLEKENVSHRLMGYGTTTNTVQGESVRVVRSPVGEEVVRGSVGGSHCVPSAEVLQLGVHGQGQGCSESNTGNDLSTSAAGGFAQADMRAMWDGEEIGSSPLGRESTEQLDRERNDVVLPVPHKMALGAWKESEKGEALSRLRTTLKAKNSLSEALVQIQEIWRSVTDEDSRQWWAARLAPSISKLLVRERKERLKALGNAVVPQVVAAVLRAVLESLEFAP